MTIPTVTFKKDEVLVLLGAGASVDAGIPHSADMVRQIEDALERDWKPYKELYNYIRSAIFYADGIRGTYANSVLYNIERLVVSLDELARREEHPLYPFVGAWNPRLLQVAGSNFENVSLFKTKILEKLRHEWIEIADYERASYFRGLIKFQRELNYPLRVFTLNYDLCVEKAYQSEHHEFPERGFSKQDRCWSHELLEEPDPAENSLYLYKLHGSIDWVLDRSGKLTFSDSTAKIKVDDGQIIFGLTYKLQYVDPFLFLMYQLRRLSLEAKLLLVVGYGFGDPHINAILRQALRGSPEKRLIAVTWSGEPRDDTERQSLCTKFQSDVLRELELKENDPRLVAICAPAKKFLSEELTLASVSKHFPAAEPIFEEVPSTS